MLPTSTEVCVPHPLHPIVTLSPRLGTATAPFDLSAATKLKDLTFLYNRPNIKRVTRALQSVKSKGLERITLRSGVYTFTSTIREKDYHEWWDLDRVLVQFLTSRSIGPKVVCEVDLDLKGRARYLLPELTRRGLLDGQVRDDMLVTR